ncbi:MAG TPA: SPFH domain-containing protein [Xanthobacteraceae bacterium]|jgi:regulator of protease activity HflC (stomatin/prohibitin superfamily)|nr:SPFH domain-containing protein [Xanthobacteraceae bacterium]
MLADLPHFNNARRYVAPLLITGAIVMALGLGLTSAISAHANAYWRLDLPIPRSLGFLGAAFLVAAAGFLSAALVVFVRLRLLEQQALQPAAPEAPISVPDGAVNVPLWRVWLAHARALMVWRVELLAAWPQALVALLFGGLAIAGVWVTWGVTPFAAADPTTLEILGGALIVAAFPLLVLERSFSGIAAEMLPDAPQLDRLLRVPLTVCLGLGIAAVLRSLGFAWAIRVEQALAILVVAVALEVVVRSLAVAFVPFAPITERRSVADSSIAGFLRFAAPSFQAFNTAVRQQFGIDLSRSWALAFVQRAMLPIALVMGILAWGVTGITALGLNERAVYERFGMPVGVLGPGLHLHLPWPAGVMRSVELGVIHDIPIAMPATGETGQIVRQSAGVDQQRQVASAEGAPPTAADRLWDASHPSEQSYLIASQANGQQTFQIADADLRVVYRVGLTDADALNAAYRVADPETLIKAATGQLLVRYFARYTLPDVLGQSRDAFTKDFRTALQDQLDKLSSGIEAISVVVEAIHPPAGAASAYHNVQAAEILANSQIAVQRASAIHSIKSAQQGAMEDRNKATAAAAELVTQAKSESILFDADREARTRDGEAFLFERRSERLASGLAKSEAIVVDHRLKGQNGPVIDLRSLDAGGGGRVPTARRDIVFPPGRNFSSEDDDDDAPPPPRYPSQSGTRR